MNKKLYFRSSHSKATPFSRTRKGNKMSMDDLTPLFSRPPSETKKRNSNDHYDSSSKLERSTFKKNKMMSAASVGNSAGNSVLITRNNSPIKFSMRTSQPKCPPKEKEK